MAGKPDPKVKPPIQGGKAKKGRGTGAQNQDKVAKAAKKARY